MTTNWEGVPGGPEHHTLEPHRAWCYDCQGSCYPDELCDCCHYALGHKKQWVDSGGQVLELDPWRWRAVWYGTEPPTILSHGNLIEIDHGTGQVLMEFLDAGGEWKRVD